MEGFFAGESDPVNQKLSDIFLQLHISERTGRGVHKITEAYGRETYEFRENSIVVSIPFTRVSTEERIPLSLPQLRVCLRIILKQNAFWSFVLRLKEFSKLQIC